MRTRIKKWMDYTVITMWLGVVIGSGIAIGFAATLTYLTK